MEILAAHSGHVHTSRQFVRERPGDLEHLSAVLVRLNLPALDEALAREYLKRAGSAA